MRSDNDWKRESSVSGAYHELARLMSEESAASLEDVQGAVEYLLDAIKQLRRSDSSRP